MSSKIRMSHHSVSEFGNTENNWKIQEKSNKTQEPASERVIAPYRELSLSQKNTCTTILEYNMVLDQCRTVFDVMDRNHLGEVNVRDLIFALRRDATLASFLHLDSKIKQEGSARTLQKLFAEIDADHG